MNDIKNLIDLLNATSDNNLEKYGIIYKIANIINGKIYIGKTTRDLNDRFWEHVSNKNHKCYIDRAIKKYGPSIKNAIILLKANNWLADCLHANKSYKGKTYVYLN